jgi:serine/threonine protein kinase
VIETGTVLNGTYRVEGKLGEGGMGLVYEAAHTRLPKRFAVKVLNALASVDRTALARFRREAEICSSLGHPNIVEVIDFNETPDGTPYIVMELLAGEDLGSALRRDAPLSVERALAVCEPVASALDAAHQRGIVHRDLKPQNIFISRRAHLETIKVLDFGISKVVGASDLHTQSLATMGSPGYMAPEQARGGSAAVDGSADQFALATIVYEMLAGRRAFCAPGDDVYGILFRIVEEEPVAIDGLPAPLMQVIWRGLSKLPGERYASTLEFFRELVAADRGEPTHGRVAKGSFVGKPVRGETPVASPSDAFAPTKSVPSDSRPAGEMESRAGRKKVSRIGWVVAASLSLGLAGAYVYRELRARAPLARPGVTNVEPVRATVDAPQASVVFKLALTPPGARATLDGVLIGPGEQKLPLRHEAHRLHVDAEGYESAERDIRGDRDSFVELNLVAKVRPATPPLRPKQKSRRAERPAGAFAIEDPYKK